MSPLSTLSRTPRFLAEHALFWWNRYEKRNPFASPYDLQTAKHFMEGVVRGCKAVCPTLSMYTMLQRWTDFGSGWQRRHGNKKIPSEVSESVYYVRILSRASLLLFFPYMLGLNGYRQYIQTELKKKFGLSTERRTRHYMTVHHFIILIKHMWKKDWHQYRHPRTLVQDHGAYMLFICTSGRVGEYFEFNRRRGSGRGLLCEVSVRTVWPVATEKLGHRSPLTPQTGYRLCRL